MNRTRSKHSAVDGQSRNVDRKRRMARPRFPGESRSCVVGLVARQSTGWRPIGARCTLWGGRRAPGHSPFRQWPFSPWSIGWSVQGQKLEHIDSARSRPSLQGLSLGVVSTPYCRAAKLTLVQDLGSQQEMRRLQQAGRPKRIN
ncbi:hypothetical protein KY284_003794 [Solanum tuberosum]|nr:hypothetical protein KY284_003794 [Solanum tuberosum]